MEAMCVVLANSFFSSSSDGSNDTPPPYRYTLSLLFLCVEFLGRWAMIRDTSLLSPLHFLINFIIKLPLIFLSVVPYTKLRLLLLSGPN